VLCYLFGETLAKDGRIFDNENTYRQRRIHARIKTGLRHERKESPGGHGLPGFLNSAFISLELAHQ
jgi:hypothetical protein